MIFIILWFVFIGIGAVYNYLWDIKCDWGLLRRNSRYKLLRDVLSYKNPWIYYFSKTEFHISYTNHFLNSYGDRSFLKSSYIDEFEFSCYFSGDGACLISVSDCFDYNLSQMYLEFFQVSNV